MLGPPRTRAGNDDDDEDDEGGGDAMRAPRPTPRSRSRTQPMDGRTDGREMDSPSLSERDTGKLAQPSNYASFPPPLSSSRRFSSVAHFGSNSPHFCREHSLKFDTLVS